jgi:hypothetical protein
MDPFGRVWAASSKSWRFLQYRKRRKIRTRRMIPPATPPTMAPRRADWLIVEPGEPSVAVLAGFEEAGE